MLHLASTFHYKPQERKKNIQRVISFLEMEVQAAFQCPEARPLYPNLSNGQQTALVVAVLFYIAVATCVLLKFYEFLDKERLKWWGELKQTWPLLGVFYCYSGIQDHFIGKREFLCIVPPNGTWGWWFMPVSEEFQLAATGCAEILFGLLLVVCGSGAVHNKKYRWTGQICQQSALCMFVMTLGVTFSNIYMLTHGVWVYELEDPLPFVFHVVRCTVQSLWLSNLWYMYSHKSLKDGNVRDE